MYNHHYGVGVKCSETILKQFELAIENDKKSLHLNPENTNAAKMIKKIEQRMVELTNDKIENK